MTLRHFTLCVAGVLVAMASGLVPPTVSSAEGDRALNRRVWDMEVIRTMPLDVEVLSETHSEASGTEYSVTPVAL